MLDEAPLGGDVPNRSGPGGGRSIEDERRHPANGSCEFQFQVNAMAQSLCACVCVYVCVCLYAHLVS